MGQNYRFRLVRAKLESSLILKLELELELDTKLKINYFLKFKMKLKTRFLIPPIALSSVLTALHLDSVPFTHLAKHLPHLDMTNHALISIDIQISFCNLRLISTSKRMRLKNPLHTSQVVQDSSSEITISWFDNTHKSHKCQQSPWTKQVCS